MDTNTQSYFQTELERRRTSLQAASVANVTDASLRQLLRSVDEALERLHGGTFGICEVCHDTIEADRLLCNPLLRFCLDHLSTEEARALERDLVLAAGIQRGLLPRKCDQGINGSRKEQSDQHQHNLQRPFSIQGALLLNHCGFKPSDAAPPPTEAAVASL
jgi:hypothetical protein